MKINSIIKFKINYFLIIFFLCTKTDDKKNNLYKSFSKFNYTNKNFAIIERNCKSCGLFSFFIVSLGCIHKYLIEGYIPIIDMISLPNIINGFKKTKINAWELFFEQPFGYSLENVLKNANKVKRIQCYDCKPRLSICTPFNDINLKFWHNFANKYSPIKRELIDLSNKMLTKLFKNSKNVLGVLTRGTDFISMKPKGHPIPPKLSDLIRDVQEMDNKNNYDYIFFTTEDENIREKFAKNFPKKLKEVKSKMKINYDYSKKSFLGYNKNINGNIEFNKIYLLNIIILSKCLDLITARCNGAMGVLILTNGFRNTKIYNLGVY